jgi:transposase
MPNPKRPAYPAEFRAEAIRLARSPGHTIDGVAHDLGIARESLRRWIKQAEIDAGRAGGLTTEEREDLRTLRRRVRVIEEERTRPVKAAAFFAKENDRTR